ncbi:MerC domain-containing protein [Lysobacter sp. TAF61]|uniref:MerC domain-containing protein n=1 Tax=Lysobacter sp. TAF61 TaxID=3233072 RepID=UPI003F95401F
MPPIRPRSLIDRLGAFGSLLCAIHCALLPVLIATLPSLGVATWLGSSFEAGFVIFATSLGLFSTLSGYRRHHGLRALSLVVPGLLLLWLGVMFRPLHESVIPHAIAMTLGGTLVGLGHLANLRLNHGHVHDASCVH